MKKVKLRLELDVNLTCDDGVDINKVVNNIDYDFIDKSIGATLGDCTISDWYIIDSK